VSVVAAVFFDGRSSRAQPVQLSLDNGALTIRADGWQRSELPSSIRVTPRVAGIHRTLVLSDGGQLQVDDNDAVDAWFPNRDRTAALIDRLERNSVVVAASILITAVGLAGLFFFGIPMAAEKIAARIPDSVARTMGEQTATLLDRFGFENSELPQQRRDELRATFKKYVADLPDPAHYELRFMKAHMANAFALPGGIIVVTDGMIRTIGATDAKVAGGKAPSSKTASNGTSSSKSAPADDDKDDDDDDSASSTVSKSDAQAKGDDDTSASDEEKFKAADERFLAVMAHEIGHEEHRHVLRSVLQSSGVVLIGAYFTGDVSSASTLVVAVPTFLLNSHYSRGFEQEADDYAFASLARHGISPGRFAEVMTAMQRTYPDIRHESGYLSTHPPTMERILNAQAAAERFRSRGDP
jgi:Zn-dependent protease with chaperone function